MGKRYEIVDSPGENVGRISIALTSIQPSARQLSNWQYLPIPLVVAGVSEPRDRWSYLIKLYVIE